MKIRQQSNLRNDAHQFHLEQGYNYNQKSSALLAPLLSVAYKAVFVTHSKTWVEVEGGYIIQKSWVFIWSSQKQFSAGWTRETNQPNPNSSIYILSLHSRTTQSPRRTPPTDHNLLAWVFYTHIHQQSLHFFFLLKRLWMLNVMWSCSTLPHKGNGERSCLAGWEWEWASFKKVKKLKTNVIKECSLRPNFTLVILLWLSDKKKEILQQVYEHQILSSSFSSYSQVKPI